MFRPLRTRTRSLLALLAASALLAAGTAGCGSSQADELLQQGREALEAKDIETAYERLKALRVEHPDREQTREAWPMATTAFRGLWWAKRLENELRSDWVRTESAFMYDWLASYFGTETFPVEETRLLLRAMPYWFYKDFVERTKGHPGVSRWDLEWDKDNGRMTTITGTLKGEAATDEVARAD